MQQESPTDRKRKGIFVGDDQWRQLKLYCVKHNLNVVDKAGDIIEAWVVENCS